MTWWLPNNMLNANLEKHVVWWLHFLIAIMCEKAYETQMKKDLVSIQGFYNPKVSLSLLVEHGYYHTDILSGKIE